MWSFVKRHLFLLTLVFIVAFLLLFVVTLFPGWRPFGPTVRITRGDCDKIHKGMTEKQVEEILGGPEGNYNFRGFEAEIFMNVVGTKSRKKWTGNRAYIIVFFDEDDKVLSKVFMPLPRDD